MVRVERLFGVLVLGGAALACDDSKGGEYKAGGSGSPSSHAGDMGQGLFDAGANGGSVSAGSSGTDSASSGSPESGGPAGSSNGASGDGNGGTSDGGTGSVSAGGMGAAGVAGGGAFNAGGSAGSGGGLQCHIDAKGYARSGDPCGCPCCWAMDCLNTDETCCAGFCRAATLDCCGL